MSCAAFVNSGSVFIFSRAALYSGDVRSSGLPSGPLTEARTFAASASTCACVAAGAFVADAAAAGFCSAGVVSTPSNLFVKAIASAITGDGGGASTPAAAAWSSSGRTFLTSRTAFSTTESPCRTSLWNAA